MRARDLGEYQLREYVSNSIKASYKVQPEYFPLIEEVIVRRALLYDFDISRVNLDLERGQRALTKIRYRKFSKEEMGFFGYYRPGKKDIEFNKEVFEKKSDGVELFAIFAHEFTHALCKDEDGFDILATRIIRNTKNNVTTMTNRYNNLKNSFLLEIIVTKLSERILASGYRNDFLQVSTEYNSRNTMGYQFSAAILEMIETAYGLDEIEFLSKAADGGRLTLAKVLSERTGFNLEKSYDILDQIELQYSVIHNLLFLNKINGVDKSRYNDLGVNFSGIYKKCLDIAIERAKATKVYTIEDAEKVCEQLKYDYNRITLLANKFIDRNKHNIETLLYGSSKSIIDEDQFKESFFKTVKQQQQQMVVRIESMEEALRTISTDDVVINSFNEARMLEFKEKQTILLRKDLRTFQFQVKQDTMDRNRELVYSWDNTYIENVALNLLNPKLRRQTKINRFFDKMKDLILFKSVKNQRLALMGDIQSDYTNYSNKHKKFKNRINGNGRYSIPSQKTAKGTNSTTIKYFDRNNDRNDYDDRIAG